MDSDVRAGRLDWGRLGTVPVTVLLLLGNAAGMLGAARRSADLGAVQLLASMLASLATLAFLLMVVLAYLRRGPASATTSSWTARTAGIVATFLPMVAAPLFGVGAGERRDLASFALVVVGTLWSLWSLSALGTNLSIFAQTRALADTGPYRWVRHPLYLGEIVATLGLVVRSATPQPALAAWVLLVCLQAYRAWHEEWLLSTTLPGYPSYQRRTARLVPGVF
ncbi:MAG: methyltransferase family protein [Motilibacteraceae bacterium]